MTGARPGNLAAHLAAFCGALRERAVAVSISDEADGLGALVLVDVSDREEVRRALKIALKIRPRGARAFEELFELFFPAGGGAASIARAARQRSSIPRSAKPVHRRAIEQPVAENAGPPAVSGDLPAWSPDALLRRKSFEECEPGDLAVMERLLERLAEKLATRPSRRLVPARSRGRMDPRRSFRAALATDGEFLRLARRRRAVEKARIVALCDTSGSMDAHARFLLAFLLSLRRAARTAEVFAFNTTLTRLTPTLAPGRISRELDRLAAAVPDWSGGTRIGECLAEFVSSHMVGLVDSKTVVVIFSDGLDRGDTAVLTRAMRAIHSRARRVFWLNPLLSDPRYEPTARGMAAALPHVDRLLPAHNLETLERLLPLLAA